MSLDLTAVALGTAGLLAVTVLAGGGLVLVAAAAIKGRSVPPAPRGWDSRADDDYGAGADPAPGAGALASASASADRRSVVPPWRPRPWLSATAPDRVGGQPLGECPRPPGVPGYPCSPLDD